MLHVWNIYPKNCPKVGNYSIHGASGITSQVSQEGWPSVHCITSPGMTMVGDLPTDRRRRTMCCAQRRSGPRSSLAWDGRLIGEWSSYHAIFTEKYMFLGEQITSSSGLFIMVSIMCYHHFPIQMSLVYGIYPICRHSLFPIKLVVFPWTSIIS